MTIKNYSLLILLIGFMVFLVPKLSFCQTLNLGSLVNYAAVTGSGAVTNAGTSIYTGEIGTDLGVIAGFGLPTVVNGTIYNAVSQTKQAKIDLLNVYIHLNNIAVTNTSHAAALGAETITPGVYLIPGAGSLAGTIELDGGNDSNAVFIIKFEGAFTVAVGASVVLTNGTKSANVFWIAEGAISIATSCVIKGTLLSHPGAISFAAGGHLDGRMLAFEGAITFGPGIVAVPTSLSTIPIVCNTICDNSILGTAANYAMFSSGGAVSNAGSSSGFIGDIGSNAGAVTGFATSVVVGTVQIANAATAQAKIDLQSAYDQLMLITVTNSSHAPAFGSGETLTAGVYSIAGAGSLAGNITLDGQGDPNAIFIFKFGGAFNTAAKSKVSLINGARRCNIFWIAEGAIGMGAFTFMKGNTIAHNGANNMGANGNLEGRQFSTLGAVGFSTGVVYITYSLCPNGTPIVNLPGADPVCISAAAVQLSGTPTGGIYSGTGVSAFGLFTPLTAGAGSHVITYSFTDADGFIATATTAILVNAGPAIETQPMGASLCSGSDITFSVDATAGLNAAITYQWKKGIVDIPLATDQDFSISNIITTDAATYSVVVTSCGLSVTSDFSVLAIGSAVNILVQPIAEDFCYGASTAAFNIIATGGSAYKWEVSTDAGINFTNVSNGALYSGGLTNVLTIANPTISLNGYLYRVVIAPASPCVGVTTSQIVKLAQRQTWIGIASTDWNSASNWSDGVLPSLNCDNVIIPGGVARNPVLSSGIVVINNLLIQAGGNVLINGSGVLKLSGLISNTGILDIRDGSLDLNGIIAQSVSGKVFEGNTLKNLRVSNPAGISISSAAGDSIRILDSLSFGIGNTTLTTNDNLVLASTANGTARVTDITNSGLTPGNHFVGKVTVQRFYPKSRAWRLVTTPLSNTGSIFNTWQAEGNDVAGKGMFVTGPSPTGSIGNGLDYSNYNNYSMKGWNSATNNYINVGNTITINLSNDLVTSGIAANIGYYTFVRGDRSRNPDNTIFGNLNNTTLSSTGYLQTGQQSFNFNGIASSSNPSFELIGNPYASSVDFNKITKTNVFPKRFYVYDPSLGTVGRFVTMEDFGTPGIFTPDISLSIQGNFIQSSQAFFVQVQTTGPATLTFNETDKSSNNNPLLFRPARPLTAMQSLRISLLHTNTDQSTLLMDAAVAHFDDHFDDQVDIYDALKFTNITENLSLLRYKQYLAIERRPLIKDYDTLFLQLSKTTQRSYRFSIDPANMDPTVTAFLEDSYTLLKTPINLLETSNFDFAITSDAKSSVANRFRIVFKQAALGVLPVTFKTIQANEQAGNIAVNWTVENELNIKNYIVEKSSDGIVFEKANTTTATGINSTSYHWLDLNALTGNNFYRVKSVGIDGKFDYSSVVLVQMATMESGIRIYPNPVTDNTIGAEFKNMAAGIYKLRLINAKGQIIQNRTIQHARRSSMEYIHPDNKLVPGIYQLEIIDPEKGLALIKVIVQ